jgi:predicted GIY-YIG superfamily endonuclease
LQDHIRHAKNNKKKHFTGRQKSVKLVYSEVYEDRTAAMKREREIKKLGSKYKQRLVDQDHNNS